MMFDFTSGGDPKWHIHHGDCITHMSEMPTESVDFSVFSPPFPALYAYSASDADIGNVAEMGDEASLHLGFFYKQILRLIKPGRVMVVHVAQIPRMKRTGGVGLFDFRGLNIRIAERAGFVFEYDWSVRKNPQAQAIRSKTRELQFAGLESDRAKSRGCLPDYLLKFRKPGDNECLIESASQVSREQWINWAECCWSDVIETDTLNVADGDGPNDTKHICPLQLEVIRRLILLYTNPGEIVFSPFTGIGSEGYVALGGKSKKTKRQIDDPRRFYGCELKDEYFAAACENLKRACMKRETEKVLFSATESSHRVHGE